MNGFIELTTKGKVPTFINVSKICNVFTVEITKDCLVTRITFDTDYIEVIESYDKVKGLINKS